MRYVIGLTGNIGSGKSTVLDMLGQLGAKIVDADELVHQVMQRGTPVWHAVLDTFGEEILNDHRGLDRKKLAALVFADPQALKRLEEIVHPAVSDRFLELIQDAEDPIIAVEAVKLIESGANLGLSSLWLVTCPSEERLRRLVEGRGEDPEEVEERLEAQMPEEEQALWADVVIDNGGTPEQTWEQVKAEWAKIEERLSPSTVIVRRASRKDLGSIADIVRKASGGRSASDQGTLLERLYEWAYFVSATSKIMGVVRWQATNLVASLKDLYVYPPTQRRRMGAPLLERVEQEAKTLACEVALLVADQHSSWRAIKFYRSLGYERAKPKGVARAWREVMDEHQDAGELVLLKRLR